MTYITVYDRQRTKVAVLENAFGVWEREPLNGVATLGFTLPADDPKNEYCKPLWYCRYGSGQLYRIQPSSLTVDEGRLIEYECEHVITTLIDDILLDWHQVGNLGYYTQQVISYILSHQLTQNWVLGTCEFSHQFEYGWESENLLAALFSVPTPFLADYRWEFDTNVYPWRVSLLRLDRTAQPQLYVRTAKNLLRLVRRSNPQELCTRLYAKGYGEGVNQLTIAEVNGGVPYIQAPPDVVAKYGIIQRVWVDRRYENAETLLAAAQAMLKYLQEPREQYEVDFAQVDGDPAYIAPGAVVETYDPKSGIRHSDIIVSVERRYDGSKESKIELANTTEDIAQNIADLADRQRVETTYSQGATQLYSQALQGNADANEGLVMDFYIPDDMIRVNKIEAKIRLSRFRAYSQATKGGGSTTKSTSDGGASQQTASAGGGSETTSSSGGGSQQTASAGGGGVTTAEAVSLPSQNMISEDQGGQSAQNHNHGLDRFAFGTDAYGYPRGMVAFADENLNIIGRLSWMPSGAHSHGAHSHNVTMPTHTHNVSIPSHSHNVSIPSHTHNVSIPSHAHSITLQDHTHEVTPGIFRFGNPKTFEVYVDDELKGQFASTNADVDLLPFLLDEHGLVPRGRWLSVEIRPNDLAYISIDMFIQGFIQSRGGTRA